MSFFPLIVILTFNSVFAVRDYCEIICPDGQAGGHTLCKYPEGPSKSCDEYHLYKFSKKNIKELVNEHNALRQDFFKMSGYDEKFNLEPFKWDKELAEMGQRFADQCFESTSFNALKECRNLENPNDKESMVLQNTLRISSKVYWTSLIPMDQLMQFFEENGEGIEKITWKMGNIFGCGASSFRSHIDPKVYMQLIICNYGHKKEEEITTTIPPQPENSATGRRMLVNNNNATIDEDNYKKITVNIYNRFADPESMKSNAQTNSSNGGFLIKKLLKWNRRRGYAALTSVRPVYGRWNSGKCVCQEKKAKRDLEAEDELYEKINNARETGIDFYYNEGDVCVCAVEATGAAKTKYSFHDGYRIFWVWVFYMIFK